MDEVEDQKFRRHLLLFVFAANAARIDDKNVILIFETIIKDWHQTMKNMESGW